MASSKDIKHDVQRKLRCQMHRRMLSSSNTLGGSVVILMPLCRIAMGKRGEGLLESHMRKSGWGLRASRPSTILSRAGSQLVIK